MVPLPSSHTLSPKTSALLTRAINQIHAEIHFLQVESVFIFLFEKELPVNRHITELISTEKKQSNSVTQKKKTWIRHIRASRTKCNQVKRTQNMTGTLFPLQFVSNPWTRGIIKGFLDTWQFILSVLFLLSLAEPTPPLAWITTAS